MPRGREMTKVPVADKGAMAAVFGPLTEIERIVAQADGYVVVANINSNNQAVVGGATAAAVEKMVETFNAAGMNAVRIPVSHAFHTSIVAPASPVFGQRAAPPRHAPQIPIVANVTGEFYPANADAETMLDYAGKQVACRSSSSRASTPLYRAGARVFVEVGPRRRCTASSRTSSPRTHDDVLAPTPTTRSSATPPRLNQALCGLYAAGLRASLPAAAAVAAAPS